LCGAGSVTGGLQLREAMDAPGQNLCWGARVVERAMVGSLPKEPSRLVPSRFRIGQSGGQSVPGGIVEDLFRLGRYGLLDLVGVLLRPVR